LAFILAVGFVISLALYAFAVYIVGAPPRLVKVPERFAPARAWALRWLEAGRAAAACCAWRPEADDASAARFLGYEVDWTWIAAP
jgi:hypothetical protein